MENSAEALLRNSFVCGLVFLYFYINVLVLLHVFLANEGNMGDQSAKGTDSIHNVVTGRNARPSIPPLCQDSSGLPIISLFQLPFSHPSY